MKILHMADIHLDSQLNANLDAEKRKIRKQELNRAFERAVEYGAKAGVSAILIAGDLFDKSNISKTVINVVSNAITSHPDITFYYLNGNHDSDSFLMNMEEMPDNLKIFGNSWTCYSLDEEGKVMLYGAELCKDTSDDIYESLVTDARCFNIVMLHGQNAEYKAKDKAEIIAVSKLKNKNIDYLALGHVHRYICEKLDARGVMCYPGCLEPRGFDECGKEHGFCILDINTESMEMKHEFVNNSIRSCYEIPVDITDCEDSIEVVSRMRDSIMPYVKSDDMVKFVLGGAKDAESEINMAYIMNQFAEQFFFMKVYDESKVKVDEMKYLNDKSLKGEFIRSVLADNKLDEETKGKVIRAGLLALAGEEF